MCLGYTAKSRDFQYCVIVIALCPSYCDIVLFLFVLLLFAGLLVAKTGLRCGPRALLDPSPKQGITKALWSIQRKGILCFAIFGILKTNSKILWLLKGILCQKNYLPCLNLLNLSWLQAVPLKRNSIRNRIRTESNLFTNKF